MKSLSCPLCCEQTFSYYDLKNHLSLYIQSDIHCPICDASIIGIKNLIEHLDEHDYINDELSSNYCPNVEREDERETQENFCSLFMINNMKTQNDVQEIANGTANVLSSAVFEFTNCGDKCVEESKDIQMTQKHEVYSLESVKSQETESDVQVLNDSNIHVKSEGQNCEYVHLHPESAQFIVTEDCDSCKVEADSVVENTDLVLANVLERTGIVHRLAVPKISLYPGCRFMCGMCSVSTATIELLQEHAMDEHDIAHMVMTIPVITEELGIDMLSSKDISAISEETIEAETQTEDLPFSSVYIHDDPSFLPSTHYAEEVVLTSTVHKQKKEAKYTCVICDKTFLTPGLLTNHTYTHKPEKTWPLKCPECDMRFIQKVIMHRHIQSVHQGLVKRKKNKAAEEPVMCEECGRVLCNAKVYKAHKHTMHGPGNPQIFPCEHCNRKYSNRTQLRVHLERVHLKVRRCQCTTCGKKFFDRSSLKAHAKIHMEVKPFPCSFCEKRYGSPFEVRRHEQGHTGEKPYQCRYCDKRFRNGYFLNVHHRLHTGERPFSCTLCGAAFASKQTLRNHKFIHVDTKLFKCSYCDKSFKTRIQRYCHERQHTRPFKCHICQKGFSSGAILNKHIMAHSKNYTCASCDSRFTAFHKLKKHIKEGCVVLEETLVANGGEYILPDSGFVINTKDGYISAEETVAATERILFSDDEFMRKTNCTMLSSIV